MDMKVTIDGLMEAFIDFMCWGFISMMAIHLVTDLMLLMYMFWLAWSHQ